MEKFVALRRIEGKDYRSQARNLKRFDSFLSRRKWKGRWLPREVIDDYSLSQAHVAPSARRTEMSVVRQFCIYLSLFEPRCYVPDGVWAGDPSVLRIPFVFTKPQICDLLDRARELPQWPYALRPHMYQTFFGLLYTTGIRVGEALALNVDDIDLRLQRLLVRKGKFGKARWVPFAASTACRLQEYLDRRLRVAPSTAEAPLFISWKAERLAHRTADNNFWLVMRAGGFSKQSRAGPTIHSLRHTFACHCLLRWYRAGLDVNALLPALATYMGHVDVQYTARYIHAIPELLEQMHQRFLKHYRKAIKNGGSQ
jgi:site-specific recombinase XerD